MSADNTETAQPSAAEVVLPESGQAIPDRGPFAILAVLLLGLMVVGGVFAIRKGKQSA
jgi:hypothetical protein